MYRKHLNIVGNRWSILASNRTANRSRISLVPFDQTPIFVQFTAAVYVWYTQREQRKLVDWLTEDSPVYQGDRSNRLSYERRFLAGDSFLLIQTSSLLRT